MITLHARVTMSLTLSDELWSHIYNRIKADDGEAKHVLYALFKDMGKIEDNRDSYIPGAWLAKDTTGDEDADGFDDINF